MSLLTDLFISCTTQALNKSTHKGGSVKVGLDGTVLPEFQVKKESTRVKQQPSLCCVYTCRRLIDHLCHDCRWRAHGSSRCDFLLKNPDFLLKTVEFIMKMQLRERKEAVKAAVRSRPASCDDGQVTGKPSIDLSIAGMFY